MLTKNNPREAEKYLKSVHWESDVEMASAPSEKNKEQVENKQDDTMSELELLRAEYEEKIGKVPNRYKNDADWLEVKLADPFEIDENPIDEDLD
jgi:hypothetical protein